MKRHIKGKCNQLALLFNDELCYAKQHLGLIQGHCFNDTSN